MAAVYLLASKFKGTLYCGSTIDLLARVYAHRTGEGSVFTRKYSVIRLVWYEVHDSIAAAHHRERAIKRWRRDWKEALIERDNPDWTDLYWSVMGVTDTRKPLRGDR